MTDTPNPKTKQTNTQIRSLFTGITHSVKQHTKSRLNFQEDNLIAILHTEMSKQYRPDSRFVPNQWETALLCNDVSHWLGANLEYAIFQCFAEETAEVKYIWAFCATIQVLCSPSGRASYRKISWSLEALRFGFRFFQTLWNLTATSAVALPHCLSHFRAMRSISKLQDFTRLGGKMPYRLVNRGHRCKTETVGLCCSYRSMQRAFSLSVRYRNIAEFYVPGVSNIHTVFA